MNSLQHKFTRRGENGRFLKLLLLSVLFLTVILLSTGKTSSTALAKTLKQPEATPTVGPAWVFQGPAPQTNAQQDLANIVAADEPVSGAVAAIAASPTDPDLIYIGAANGGVWKTTNATDPSPTWTPLTDHLQSLSIGLDALTLDPLDATGQTVIVGTGRFSGYANRGDDLVGIYYTTDGGTTWTVSTSPLLSAANITGVAARGNTLLVASEDGLLRSTTGPLGTWSKISGSGGLPDAQASSIVADPNDNNRFYVTFTGASGGLFRSDDLGATWTDITGAINVISADTDAFDTAVYNDGVTNVITVVLNGTVNGAEGNAIYRSVNGAAFTALDAPDVFRDAYGKFGITADTTNSDLVYVSGGYALIGSNPFLATTYRVDASQPSGSQLTHLYSGVSTETLTSMNATQTYMYVRSTASFLQEPPFDITVDSEQMTVTEITEPSWYYRLVVTRGVNATTASAHANYSMVASSAAFGAPHVDINNLAIDANGSLLMGAHGGIFQLPDPDSAAATANTWLSKNGNLGVSEMHDIAYDHVSDTLIGSNQDNCVVFQAAPGNMTWPVGSGFSGDGGDVAVADIGGGQSVRYASNQNLGSFSRLIYDAGNNLVSNTSLSTAVVTDKQFTTPIAVNAVDPNRLLIGGSDNLYESLDMGDTINKIATVGVYSRAIAFGGYKNGLANPDVFYVADETDTFYARTAANGPVTTYNVPGAWYIRDIVMNPDDWMNVFVVDGDDVLVSTDAGATWTDITGDLLSISSDEFATVEYVAAPSPYLVVGTRSGVFATNLAAAGTWFELGTDLPDVLVFELDYDATDDVLAAATLGRGAWLLSDASTALTPAGVPPVLAMTAAPTAVDEGSTEYTYSFAVTDPGDSFTVTTLTVSAGGELVSGSLETSGTGGSFKVTFPDGPASPTIDLQVTDSTALTSNIESTAVTVNNLNPTPTILGLPTSGSPGTPVNIVASATDPGAADTTAGFSWYWWVFKNGATYDQGDTSLNYSFTPDETAEYKVWLKATDKDGGYRWTYKVMNAASPDLTIDAVSLTIPEGLTAENAGTYAHDGGGPIAMSASSGTLYQPWSLVNDDFNGQPQGTGLTTLNNFWVVGQISGGPYGVDVFGTGFNDYYPGNGNYIELDANLGSGSGWIRKGVSVEVGGVYELSFKIGTNLDGPTDNSVRVYIGNIPGTTGLSFDETFAAPTTLTTVVRRFTATTVTSSPYLTFREAGPSDGYGTIIDDVKLTLLNPVSVPPVSAGSLFVSRYAQLGEDDTGAVDGATGNAASALRRQNLVGLLPVHTSTITREGSPTYTSSITTTSGSVLGMSLNGSTDAYISTPPGISTAVTDDFGMEAWVKPDTAAVDQVIVYSGNTGTNGFGLVIENGTYQGLYGGVTYFDSGVAATPGTWSHVALVRDGGVSKLFVDGTLAFSGSIGAPNSISGAGTKFAIGRAPEAAVDYLDGAVDEVRLFTFDTGTFDAQDLLVNSSVSGNWEWFLATDDGPTESQTITVTATTGVSGDTSSMPFPLVVENVAPSATFGNGGAVDEGSIGSVSFSEQFDPSTADTSAGFRYAYDFDNDGVFDVGDGTYAGSVSSASETIPASYLDDGPGTQTVHGRIIDKDDGYSDYTTAVTIDNIAPTASASGPASGLTGQLLTFDIGATDPSTTDQAAGFSYSIDWGDGSPLQNIAQAAGNGTTTASHAFATANNYTVQVTATDKNSGLSTAASTAIQIDALDASNLQTLIATAPFVELAVADDAALQSQIAAINGLTAPASPKAITLILGAGPYSGVTLSPPDNIILNLAGNDTGDVDGTQIASSSGPAVTVSSGEVFVQGNILATTADAPAVLVTGGHLTLDQDEILESPGFINPAVQVTGGSANLGFDVLMKVDGVGAFVSTYARSALVPHPEGIDAELTPNTYQIDDGLIDDTINAVSLSSTGLSSSAPATTYGQVVTFTATIDVKAIEHGPATGTVDFYDDETLMGSGMVSVVDEAFVTSYITGTLGVGEHTIMALYSGDNAYVASSAVMTHTVTTATLPASIAISNTVDVALGWELNAIFCGYRAYRNLTPYFVPATADTTLADDLAANIDEFIVLNEVLAATNYFYLVTGRSCLAGGAAGDDAAVSNETGLFHFAIVPGE